MAKVDLNPMLFEYARSLDKTVDSILPILQFEAEKRHPIRYKVGYKLLNQSLEVAKSIIKLTKIAGDTKLSAVAENYQSIIALSRVLTEACNKFYYLAIESKDDEELKLRWYYYSYVACVKYKQLMLNIPSLGDDPERDRVFANIDKSISKHKAALLNAGLENWPTFKTLGAQKGGHKLQQKIREGETQEDYIKSDFQRALSIRLNKIERKHYEGLGNVAVHSSAFMLFFRDPLPEDGMGLVAQSACLYLFNASRHLALCGLELTDKFPALEDLSDAKTKEEWRELSGQIKEPTYLFAQP